MHNLAAITFHYDPVEDRILMVGNLNNDQPRRDFWLTRNITLKLLEALSTLVRQTSEQVVNAPQEHQSGIAQFEHEKAQQNMRVHSETHSPVSESASLLYKIDVSHRGHRYQVRFYDHEAEDAQAQAVLSHDELHQVLSLLHRGALELNWGVEAQLFDNLVRHSTALQ